MKAFGGPDRSHLFGGSKKPHLAKLDGEFLAWDELKVAMSIIPLRDLKAVWKDLVPQSTQYPNINNSLPRSERARVVKPYRLRKKLCHDSETTQWRADEWLGQAPFTFPRAIFAGRTHRGQLCRKFDSVGRRMAISDSVLRTAWAVAKNFEGPYRLSTFVAILSMRQRQHSISDLIYGLTIFLKGECHCYHSRYKLTSPR